MTDLLRWGDGASSQPTVDSASGPRSVADRNARPALFAFVLVAVVTLLVFLALGHDHWFLRDEWDFLIARDGGDVGDLLRPHNEHWSTLPILVYRLLFRVFGLHTYVPYQLVVILLHLTAGFLLRMVMRRAGVGPWMATVAATLFILFGAGNENIVWAFQIGFVGSLVFGLTQLLLADHDGPIDRRDWLALLAGFVALLCSGVGVTMVVVVGMAGLVRRGWRIALFHTAPLAGVFALWWISVARDTYGNPSGGLGQLAEFVARGFGATFDAFGQLPGAGIAFGLLLVVGLALAWHDLDRTELRKRVAAPGALLVGAVVFLVITGLGRAAIILLFGGRFPGRYLHIVAALSLPAVAVAAQALVRRWRILAPAVLVLFLIGIPGNLQALADYNNSVGLLPRRPFFQYSLVQSKERTNATDCENVVTPVQRRLDTGQSLRISGGRLRVADLDFGLGAFLLLHYNPVDGHTLTARVGPLRLGLAPDNRAKPVVVCNG